MPLPTVVGALVALGTWSWAPLLWAAIADVAIVSLLVWSFKRFFRGVQLDPQQVEKHLAFYAPTEQQDQVSQREVAEESSFFLRRHLSPGEESGTAEGVQDGGSQLLQLCDAAVSQDMESPLQHGHRCVLVL
jgi:hypothetical protein